MASPAVESVLMKRKSQDAGLSDLCGPKEEPVVDEQHADELVGDTIAEGIDDGEPLFQLDVDDVCNHANGTQENGKATENEAAAVLERLEKLTKDGSSEAPKTEEENHETTKESEGAGCSEGETEGNSGRSPKKPRLVWTSELHARFMNAVNHLGIKSESCGRASALLFVQRVLLT